MAYFRRDYAVVRKNTWTWIDAVASHEGVYTVQRIIGTRLHSDQDVVTGLEFSSLDALARFLGAQAKKDFAIFWLSVAEATNADTGLRDLLSPIQPRI